MTTTTKMTVRVDQDWHIALKQAALDRRTTVTQIVIDAVNKYLEEATNMMVTLKYDGKSIGNAHTNHSLSMDEVLDLLNIDPNEIVDGELRWDYELFELVDAAERAAYWVNEETGAELKLTGPEHASLSGEALVAEAKRYAAAEGIDISDGKIVIVD